MTPHGTYTRYVYNRCRCDECRTANAEYHRSARARRAHIPAPVHGVSSSYVNWDCRCAPCTEAHSARVRAYRARRAVA